MEIFFGVFLAAICGAIGFGGWKLFQWGRVPSMIRKPAGVILMGGGALFGILFLSFGFDPPSPEKMAADNLAREQAAEARKQEHSEEERVRQALVAEGERTATKAKEEARIAAIEKRRSGLHCLSSWDGSNRDAVSRIKASYLRDPDSFEHIETRILPLDESSGEHGAIMTYRARNGFGGMNVEQIYMRINSESCDARLLPDGPGSKNR